MRRLGRAMVFFAVVTSLFFVVRSMDYRSIESWFWPAVSPVTGATPVRVFSLAEGNPLHFRLPARANRLRFLVNAASNGDTASPGPPQEAIFFYKILNARGEVLAEKKLSAVFSDAVQSTARTQRFRDETRYLGADGKRIHGDLDYFVDVANLPEAKSVELGIVDMGPDIDWLAVRVGFRVHREKHEAEKQWLRLSANKQETLAAASIIPKDLLYPEQKQALLAHAWERIGPQGVNGEDYQERVIYRIERPEVEEPYNVANVEAGVYIDATHWYSQRIDTQGTELVITSSQVPEQRVDITVYERSGKWPDVQRRQFTYEILQGQPLRWKSERDVYGVVIKSEHEAYVNQVMNAQETVPSLDGVKVWRVDESRKLRYAIAHIGAHATPLRLDMRMSSPDQGAQLRVLGSGAQETIEWTCSFNAQPASPLHRLLPFEATQQVTAAQACFMEIPPAITEIELASDNTVWVNAYSRPPRLPYHKTLAENETAAAMRAWHTFLPVARQPLLMSTGGAEASDSLVSVKLPMFDDFQENTVSDDVREDLSPHDGQAIAQRVYLPRDPNQAMSQGLASLAFYPLRPGKNDVVLVSDRAKQRIRPEVLLLNARQTPSRVQLQLPSQKIFSRDVLAGAIRFFLPEMNPGAHQISVTTDATHVYINAIAQSADSGVALIPRIAWQLSTAEQQFSFEKDTEQEYISVELLRPSPGAEPLQVGIQMTHAQRLYPAREYTFASRQIQVMPLPGDEAGWIEHRHPAHLQRYSTVVFPVGADIQNGTVTFSLRVDQPDVLAVVSRMKSSPALRYRFYQEDTLASN